MLKCGTGQTRTGGGVLMSVAGSTWEGEQEGGRSILAREWLRNHAENSIGGASSTSIIAKRVLELPGA
jgi:hypothetical protein